MRSKPQSVITLTPFTKTGPKYGVDYVVGDYVAARVVIHNQVRVSGVCRIWGAQIQIDELGNEQANLVSKTNLNEAGKKKYVLLGRNLLGTVHQPVVVISDVGLAAGGRREYAAGLAEVVKHALISGGDLVGLLRERAAGLRAGDPGVLAEVVARSVRVKAGIVSGDEREAGDRLHLNYGHTFGHAIEQVSGPDVADDGEAVAIGMMAAAYLARRQGRIGDDLVALHRELLTGLGLPVSGRYSLGDLREAWLRDKKYRGSARFVVLNGLGQPVSGVPADETSLDRVLADLARP